MRIFHRVKSRIALFLTLAMILSMIPAPSSADAAVSATEINENFNSFSPPINVGGTNYGFNSGSTTYNKWNANANTNYWSVVNDVYGNGKAINISGTQSSTTMLFSKDVFLSDNVVYSAKVKATTNKMVGLTARYKSSSAFYYFSLSNLGNNEGAITIGKRGSGSNVQLYPTTGNVKIYNFDPNRYYKLTFIIKGSTLIGSVEGGPTIMVTDTSNPESSPQGSIGFFAEGSGAGYFDDVYATSNIPAAPTNFSAISTVDNQINLGWAGSADKYLIKRSSTSGGTFTDFATVTSTTYTDLVSNGTPYSYIVTPVEEVSIDATSILNLEGFPTGLLTLTSIPSTQIPSAPTNLYAAVGPDRATLTWNLTNSNTGYRVKRSQQPGGPYNTIATLGATESSYTDTGLQIGQTYYYIVTAFNNTGESQASNQVSAIPSLPPNAPDGLIAFSGYESAQLQWNSVSEAVYYTVKRGTSPNGPFVPIATNVTSTNHLDSSGLVNGTSYFYVVQALNTSGVSSIDSNVAQATPQKKHPILATNVSSSSNDGNLPSNAVDDKASTRWGAEGLGQWLEVDLEKVSSIGHLGIIFYKGDIRSTKFDVAVSDDRVTWNKIYSGQSSGSSVGMEVIDIPNTNARYLRVIGQGNPFNNYMGIQELHVYTPNPNGLLLLPVTPENISSPPAAIPFIKPGYYNADGTPHIPPTPNAKSPTGKTINVVTEYHADPEDNNNDDREAIQQAINAAQAGDELYFPNGVYNLKSWMPAYPTLQLKEDKNSHLILKDGVNFRGESQEGTIFKSDFDNLQGGITGSSSRIFTLINKRNVVISNMTLTSSWNGTYPTDPRTSNPERGGPKNGIYIDDSTDKLLNSPTESMNIVIDHVTIEKYEKFGVRVSKAHDVTIKNSIFRNATDIGGGGAGYGVSIQGEFKENRLGYNNDTRWNIVENNVFDGTNALRHGALLQGYAHNNVVRNNTFLNTTYDSIDLHGEDEYLNEIHNNKIIGTKRGGGIGVGNTGGTYPSNHDASGPFNYIHDNLIQNAQRGIQVYMGSPDTIIENNTIESTPELEATRPFPTDDGIQIFNAPRTIVRNNIIRNFTGAFSHGIWIAHDNGDSGANFVGAGDPQDPIIVGNTVTGNTYGITVDAGSGIVLEENIIKENKFGNLIRTQDASIYNEAIIASEDALISKVAPAINFGTDAKFTMTTDATGNKAAIAYFKFQVSEIEKVRDASIQLSGRLTDLNPGADAYSLDVYGIQAPWSEADITWSQSPNHVNALPYVDGVGTTAVKLGTITVTGNAAQSFSLNSQALTNFVKASANGEVSIMVLDSKGQNANLEIYSKESAFEPLRPILKLSKVGQVKVDNPILLDESNNLVTQLSPSKDVTAIVSVVNHSNTEFNGTLIAALYPEGQSPIYVGSTPITVGAEKGGTAQIKLTLPSNVTNHSLKLFVWDNFNGMYPYTEPVIFK